MEDFVVENIPPDVYLKLLLSARLHKRSIEEEALHILRCSVAIEPPKPQAGLE